jgi:hypothetical protein
MEFDVPTGQLFYFPPEGHV